MTERSEEPAPPSTSEASEGEEEEYVPTPFDGPYVLPVLFGMLTLWFGYDGWFSTDPDLADDLLFNRGGAVVFAVACAWTWFQAKRREQDAAPSD